MTLTASGAEYYEFFTRIMAELADIKQRNNLDEANKLTFTLGILKDWAIYPQLQQMDQQLQAIYPTISIRIQPMTPNELMEALANNKLDAALCISNGMVQRIGTKNYIREIRLGSVQKGILYADSLFMHVPTTFQDFSEQTMYSVSNHFKAMAVEENSLICNHYGFQPELISYDDLTQVLAMVAMGKGFTILDEWSIYRFVPDLCYLPLNYHHDVSLFLPDQINNDLLNSVISILKKQFT